MAIIVKKFGGTSVKDTQRLEVVAKRLQAEKNPDDQLVIVVSAMAGMTDRLVGYTKDFGHLHHSLSFDQAYDMVVTTGEQITTGLMAMALEKHGLKAKPMLAWQVGLTSSEDHGKALIENVQTDLIKKHLDNGHVVVMPGFQAITRNGQITSLGRGGSDTTAVALAAALDAERCDIYTDVEGVYTADPRSVKTARKIEKLTFEEMFEMASLGSKVLKNRCVELAMKHGVRLQVLSSYAKTSGTFIVDPEELMEKPIVSGIAVSNNEARISLREMPYDITAKAKLFELLAQENFNIDMIVQAVTKQRGTTDLSFTLPNDEVERCLAVLENAKQILGFERLEHANGLSKLSIIGIGMNSHPGVASLLFASLAQANVNVQLISTSEIKISIVINSDQADQVANILHQAYRLDEGSSYAC